MTHNGNAKLVPRAENTDMKVLPLIALFALAGTGVAQFDDDADSDVVRVLRPQTSAVLRAFDDDALRVISPRLDAALSDESDEPKDNTSIESILAPTRAARRVVVEESEESPEFIGRLSANPFDADSTANPYSQAGSPYSAKSVNNPYGQYGSEYSAKSARNPYATDAPKIIAEDGQYLGRLSENKFDPDSTANPYGRYGSPYSPTSINNPYSPYGSPYSPKSPNNPYTTKAPLLFGD